MKFTQQNFPDAFRQLNTSKKGVSNKVSYRSFIYYLLINICKKFHSSYTIGND